MEEKRWEMKRQENDSSRHRVYEEIVDMVLQKIRSGELKPGSKLPSERKLAQEFNASRTAVREAMCTLASRGYVKARVGDGTFVREVTADDLFQPLPDVLAGDRKLIRDVLDVRILLETESAALASVHANRKDIILLEEAVNKMQEDVSTGRNGLEYDSLFHQRLAAASSNEALAQILTVCSELLSKSTRNSLLQPGRPQESVDDHRSILEAVISRDSEKASEAMRNHLQKGYPLILN